ncbi:SDR family oxidoreductase [Paeniglutamicibacter sulfureus]|uniref:SDR family oxidoreductase n=1 Tax=Paeniglutamicibacter sulfureus TaxID=43666 RepID=UPI002666C206|nr:SDR family oxidoreductase [Paeniglutamicibacter sulfureus]MDO2934512.1 SDR family oxidoreductase [Paeniglutamicibacter sulfureus]
MTILVTGATGKLGRLVVEALLERNVPAEQIVAGGRNLSRLADLAQLGVKVRAMDYSDPASLREAFTGVEKLLLVSGSEPGPRVAQHLDVIETAKEAGVQLLAYTSIPNADTTTMALAEDHQVTERALRDSGIPYVLLRNGWYLENYTDQLEGYLQHGSVFGSAGEGRLNGASRADLAQAAAAVLLADDQAGMVYELGGEESFTLDDLAREVSTATGQTVTYQDLPEEDFSRLLVGAGVPESFARILADSDSGIARGELLVEGNALSSLIGRPATTLAQAVRSAAGELATQQA